MKKVCKKMRLKHAWLLLLLICSARPNPFPSVPGTEEADAEWDRVEAEMETEPDEEVYQDLVPGSPISDVTFLKSRSSVPQRKEGHWYRIVSVSQDPKELFRPEKGVRPVPESVKKMLRAPPPPIASPGGTSTSKLVDVLCHVDRMYVRVRRELFSTPEAFKDLRLGVCPVNEGTADHYYLLYLLKSDCGFKKESNKDEMFVSIVLHYKPTTPVVRDMPFDIPLQCKYPRHFHSFNPGISIQLKKGTVYKALRPKHSYILTSQDASGNQIVGDKSFMLGEPMYFEVKRADDRPTDLRLYIKKCFMTPSRDPNSEPKYAIIDNQGCMYDSEVTTQSLFLKGPLDVQKFRVSAFIFKDMVATSSPQFQQLYLHCELSMAHRTPTPRSKACHFDHAAKKWKELYGKDHVCACCTDSSCMSQPKATGNVVSSPSWKVNFKGDDAKPEFELSPTSSSWGTSILEDMTQHGDFLSYWDTMT
ncbi:zona pellucida sperm-binding protein 3 isoform X1 [Nerophis ophidion]|uniref:zona pellucida sperm-binding protein 3 isoform X1 n=1 Tax=Nerophis ophidion TaxID=159077 RepID=UPI002ADFC33A|nr:zona pellucida sperm-binding protein 3 isoform X1 [Nerophis ophidion]